MSLGKRTTIPIRDEWDARFCELVKKNSGDIVKGLERPEFQDYCEEKEQRRNEYLRSADNPNKRHTFEKKESMFGLIALSCAELLSSTKKTPIPKKKSSGDRKLLAEKKLKDAATDKFERRTAITLRDLHELHLCLDRSVDDLFGIADPSMVAEMIYLTDADIVNLYSAGKSVPDYVPLVVRCVPLLGIYLVLWRDYENNQPRFRYKIIDVFGLFTAKNSGDGSPQEILIADPIFEPYEDRNNQKNTVKIFKNAEAFFDRCCTLAKGIFVNNQGGALQYRKELLGKDPDADNMLVHRQAAFFAWDPIGAYDDLPSGSFDTKGKLFEKTIKTFMVDYNREQERLSAEKTVPAHRPAKNSVDALTQGARSSSIKAYSTKE